MNTDTLNAIIHEVDLLEESITSKRTSAGPHARGKIREVGVRLRDLRGHMIRDQGLRPARTTPEGYDHLTWVRDRFDKLWQYGAGADVWRLRTGDPISGPMAPWSARSYQRLQHEFGPLTPVFGKFVNPDPTEIPIDVHATSATPQSGDTVAGNVVPYEDGDELLDREDRSWKYSSEHDAWWRFDVLGRPGHYSYAKMVETAGPMHRRQRTTADVARAARSAYELSALYVSADAQAYAVDALYKIATDLERICGQR